MPTPSEAIGRGLPKKRDTDNRYDTSHGERSLGDESIPFIPLRSEEPDSEIEQSSGGAPIQGRQVSNLAAETLETSEEPVVASEKKSKNFSLKEINTLLEESARDIDAFNLKYSTKVDLLSLKKLPFLIKQTSEHDTERKSMLQKYLQASKDDIYDLKQCQQQITEKINKITEIMNSLNNPEHTLKELISKETQQNLKKTMLVLKKIKPNIDSVCSFYDLSQEELGKELIQTFKDKMQDTYIKASNTGILNTVAIFFIALFASITCILTAISVLPVIAFIPMFIVSCGLVLYFAPMISNDELKATLAFVKHLTENFLHDIIDSDKQLIMSELSKKILDNDDYHHFIAVFRGVLLKVFARYANDKELSQLPTAETQIYINNFFIEIFNVIKSEDAEENKKLQQAKKDYLLKMIEDESVITDFLEAITSRSLDDKKTQQKSFNLSEINRYALIHTVRLGVFRCFINEFPKDPKIIEIKKLLEKNRSRFLQLNN